MKDLIYCYLSFHGINQLNELSLTNTLQLIYNATKEETFATIKYAIRRATACLLQLSRSDQLLVSYSVKAS
jgi:transketolase